MVEIGCEGGVAAKEVRLELFFAARWELDPDSGFTYCTQRKRIST
jgi:hypothetical protein